MSGGPRYVLFHPRWHRRPMSVWWWLEKWPYARFVLRELTSLFVASFCAITLWGLRSLSQGPDAYGRFLERMGTAPFLVLNGLSLAAALFHALTWFHLAPKAMVLAVRGKKVPDGVIVAVNYLAWAAASILVARALMGE